MRSRVNKTALLVSVLAVAIAGSALAQSDAPTLQHQGGSNELEIQPRLNSQQRSATPPQDDNTRIIPVIPRDQQVLILPQASRDFIGKWGGHLTLDHHSDNVEPPDSTVVSVLFGERDGGVVLATDVLSSRNVNVLQSTADSDGPRAVTVTVQAVDFSARPPLRQVNKLNLRLIGPDQVQCDQLADFYITGISQPVAEIEYTGTLKALTQREDRILAQEAAESGKRPIWHIQEGNPPPGE
jgi:hypothetical protein